MIEVAYVQTIASYDRWQNRSLIAAADKLYDAERWRNRGAFFESIAETLNHILWDHRVWLARQRHDYSVAMKIGARHPYKDVPRNWSDYKRDRSFLDDEIQQFCERVTETDISRNIKWRRGDEEVSTNFGFNLVHMFNHAVHYRGQVHAMLTSAGVDPGTTDLPMMPDST